MKIKFLSSLLLSSSTFNLIEGHGYLKRPLCCNLYAYQEKGEESSVFGAVEWVKGDNDCGFGCLDGECVLQQGMVCGVNEVADLVTIWVVGDEGGPVWEFHVWYRISQFIVFTLYFLYSKTLNLISFSERRLLRLRMIEIVGR